MQLGNDVKTWNLVIVFAAITLAAVAVGEFVIPKASMVTERNKVAKKQEEMRIENKHKADRITVLEKQIKERAFTGNAEEVTPKVLAQVNAVAAKDKITVKSFRPQKPVVSDGIARLAYTVQLTGKFKDIVSFVRTGDEQSTIFGVSLLQVSAADGETDTVNATVGVTAFTLLPEEKPPAATTNKTSR